MLSAYKKLLGLYPADVRFAYGEQMISDFNLGLTLSRQRGLAFSAAFLSRHLIFLLCDAAAERVNSLYSHRSFHGRCQPNPGVVRPPNMGKSEWFGRDASYAPAVDTPPKLVL